MSRIAELARLVDGLTVATPFGDFVTVSAATGADSPHPEAIEVVVLQTPDGPRSDWLTDLAIGLAARVRELEAPEQCGVCLGAPLPSGRPCICGGAGTAGAEMLGLRGRIFELETTIHDLGRASLGSIDVLGARLAMLADQSRAATEWAAAHRAAKANPAGPGVFERVARAEAGVLAACPEPEVETTDASEGGSAPAGAILAPNVSADISSESAGQEGAIERDCDPRQNGAEPEARRADRIAAIDAALGGMRGRP